MGFIRRWKSSIISLRLRFLEISHWKIWVSWGVLFKGLGVQKGTQTPCWLRPCLHPHCALIRMNTVFHPPAAGTITYLLLLVNFKHVIEFLSPQLMHNVCALIWMNTVYHLPTAGTRGWSRMVGCASQVPHQHGRSVEKQEQLGYLCQLGICVSNLDAVVEKINSISDKQALLCLYNRSHSARHGREEI